jgi:hypothetical protein
MPRGFHQRVVTFTYHQATQALGYYESKCHESLALRIASIKGWEFCGEYQDAHRSGKLPTKISISEGSN